MQLDIFTLYVAIALVNLASAAFFALFFASSAPKSSEIRLTAALMALAQTLFGTGLALISVRTAPPFFYSVEIANFFFILGSALRVSAIAAFFGERRFITLSVAYAIGWLLFLQFPFFAEDVSLRVVYANSLTVVLDCYLIWMCFRHRNEPLVSSWVLAAAFLVEVIALCIFILNFWTFQPGISIERGYGAFVILVLVTALLSNVILSISALAMILERTQNQIKRLAMQDMLTGLPNRRAFFAGFDRIIEQNRGKKIGYALAIFDIDHFKQVNDTYGHACGDQVLELLGQICRENAPPGSLFGRLGGEEFAMLVPEARAEAAATRIQDIQEKFASASQKAINAQGSITLSCGIIDCKTETPAHTAMELADQCLYAAKRAGRNQIIMSSENETAFSRRSGQHACK
ncbi:diguanylate cyclase [Roseibium sp. RKSG952]|uniref:GGDEF domain-containing protein n=1 Tax=Roseibium sp. RKSG952 TaxID=2529384 RepID=UPI0012BBDAA5|nr:diguanylate cyclase [Roseibium sp. RKSG952]MTH97775.1 sensor domain-containing diguanylate cyclase [Roseibium sp. RKSG952]